MKVTEMKTKAVGIVRVGSYGTPFQEQISRAERGHQDFLLSHLVEGDTITQDREECSWLRRHLPCIYFGTWRVCSV